MTIDRKNCPMRHPETGNCLVAGGFCVDAISDEMCEALHNAYDSGYYDALRARQEAEKNKPLTMEELQKMNGQPVWLDNYPNGWRCFIVNLEHPGKDGSIRSTPCGIDLWGNGTSLSLLVECGLYRHPPKEAEKAKELT